jgi:hypothetical protein
MTSAEEFAYRPVGLVVTPFKYVVVILTGLPVLKFRIMLVCQPSAT